MKFKLDLDVLVGHHNIAELLTDDERDFVGRDVLESYQIDRQSRTDWEVRMSEAMKLALQVAEPKTFPWPNASNTKFPLVTIAALQFHARSYPILVNPMQLVGIDVFGDQNNELLNARAQRISSHMTYQCIEQSPSWETHMDRLLFTLPIMGSVFKKTYFDVKKKVNVSEFIGPWNLVADYYTVDCESANRLTHIMYLTGNDLKERALRKTFLEYSEDDTPEAQTGNKDLFQTAVDEIHGLQDVAMSGKVPYKFIEQYCSYDFDGDGYEEPYIITVREDTGQLYRIVSRFDIQDIEYDYSVEPPTVMSITPQQYITKYEFIPSPDGSFYGLGFGALLGPMNHSIDALINQVTDAGTLSNTGGGFLGRGMQMKGGQAKFSPGEWKRVDSTGDDLKKSVFPLPVREPSPVLFQMIELLINYGERIGGSVDSLSGVNPGQNTPAETSRNSIEQGMKIFSGIFKRTYRCLKEEFNKMYKLNMLYLEHNKDIDVLTSGEAPMITLEDYKGMPVLVRPAADPNIVSDSQREAQAVFVHQLAMSIPGFNIYEVTKQLLEAKRVRNISKLYPDPKGPNAVPPKTDPKIQVEQMKIELQKAQMQIDQKNEEFSQGMQKIEMQMEVQHNQAVIQKLQAEAEKLLKEAKGVDVGHQIALIELQMSKAAQENEGLLKAIKIMSDHKHTGDKNAIQARGNELAAHRDNSAVSESGAE